MNNCAICLDDINENEKTIPFKCNHTFHKKCISELVNSKCQKKYNCCLCNARVKYEYDSTNIKFNNMLEGKMIFDLNKYLDKWKNKTCINNKHNILLETIGDWSFDERSSELLKFNYQYMLIECQNCNISQTIKKI